MIRATLAFLVVLTVSIIPTVQAQRPEIGIAIGRGLVGGADSRELVGVGGELTTGGDLPGWHVRAFAEWPLATKLAFRTEIFGNWLRSGTTTLVVVQGTAVVPAQTDSGVKPNLS